jgi:hypothetical protein
MKQTLQYGTARSRPRVRSREVAAAATALYPLAMLATLYLSAAATWCIVGLRSLNYSDPAAVPALNTLALVLLLGSPLGLLVSVALGARPLNDALADAPIRWRGILLAFGAPLAAWGLALALLVADPGNVWAWFFD